MDHFIWGNSQAPLMVATSPDGPASLMISNVAGAAAPNSPGLALAEVLTVEHGRGLTNTRIDRTFIGDSLRYVSHEAGPDRLSVHQASPHGVETTTTITCSTEGPIYSIHTTVRNSGSTELHLQAVSTGVLNGLTGFLGDPADLDVWSASNEWDGENRWFRHGLEDQQGVPDIDPAAHGQAARGVVHRTASSTWSTGEFLPVAALSNRKSGRTLIWQLENNGPWRWELNTQFDRANWLTLVFLGPTDLQHAWMKPLLPGDSFTTVTASFAISSTSLDDAFGLLTTLRREVRRDAADPERPLIFNDYMNTLMGDPTTEKLMPLIDAAADAGAKYFCIDAGWYDDGTDWWPSVGQWHPSKTRFAPDGLGAVLERIRERGMKPGLWLEPEVIGVRSPIADALADEAFMTRQGVRIREHDRYFLDLRSKVARDYLDSVFDRILGGYGVEYIKWDYNVTPGLGPDGDASSPGQGLLEHLRSYLEWFSALRDRYPGVTFEACSSGAQRQDPLTTSKYDLQSTSDQQNYRLYATIAAAAPTIVPPEQAGNWAYPNPSMDLEQTAFAMVNGLAGRLYLSGYLNRMGEEQLTVINEAIALYPQVIAHNAVALPQWPIGLPRWEDGFVVLALAAEDEVLIYAWKRDDKSAVQVLPLEGVGGRDAKVDFLYPADQDTWSATWDKERGAVVLDHRQAGESARVVRVKYQS